MTPLMQCPFKFKLATIAPALTVVALLVNTEHSYALPDPISASEQPEEHRSHREINASDGPPSAQSSQPMTDERGGPSQPRQSDLHDSGGVPESLVLPAQEQTSPRTQPTPPSTKIGLDPSSSASETLSEAAAGTPPDPSSAEIPLITPLTTSETVPEEDSGPLPAVPRDEITPLPGLQPQEQPSPNHRSDASRAGVASPPVPQATQQPTRGTPSKPLDPTQVQILSPSPGAVIDVRAATVVLRFSSQAQVELRVNGKLVDPSLVGRTEEDTVNKIITQTWYGVALNEGENTLTALASTNGVQGIPVSVIVAVRGTPQQLTVETVEARLPADGRSTVTVRGEFLDAAGNRANYNGPLTLTASAGKFVGADANPDQPGFQVVAEQGEYSAALQTGTKPETVTIHAATLDLEAFTQTRFVPNLRPSIATGVIDVRIGRRGTNFYDSFRDFLPLDRNNGFDVDARAAVFATGRVGDWLFTGAFDTERGLNQDPQGRRRRFGDLQFSEEIYPVYGDSSTTERVVESEDNLFVRFERPSPVEGADTDFFMWGDYDTAEFSTLSQEFSATTRSLHGFKGNFNIGNLQLTGLFANDIEGFQRDIIAPDGTSGLYFLSRQLILPGSENVFIELEELNRPGTVLASQQLSRGADYDIDYDRGTLFFRDPILRTSIADDGTPLVRRIVATYEFEDYSTSTYLFGGRARYHFSRTPGQESWLGVSYVREDREQRDFELFGADALISIGDRAQIVAEYARSSNWSDTALEPVTASAYRFEVDAEIVKNLFGRAYFREAEAGFSNNATVSFVPGQRRYGGELTAQITPSTNLYARVDHEDNFDIAPRVLTTPFDLINPGFAPLPGEEQDNSLTTIEAGFDQQIGPVSLGLGWIRRDRRDRLATEPLQQISDQLRTSLSVPLLDNLAFRAQNDLNLSTSDPIYSNRTLLGLDWTVAPGITVGLNQQFFSGGEFGNRGITSLDAVADYEIFKNTNLTGRFSVLGGANGAIGQGAAGIKHKLVIAPGLTADIAYEYMFGNFFGRTAAGTQFRQPYAVGQGASALGIESGHNFSVGLSYTDNPDLKISANYEYRTSSAGVNSNLTASLTGKITSALTGLVSYDQAGPANQFLGLLSESANLRVGLAYRNPRNDKFNALLRFDYRNNPATIPDSILFTSGTGSTDYTVALETIFAPNWRWELYSKFAHRQSRTRLSHELLGSSAITLGQLRATYRLGYQWDIAGEGRIISQPSAGFTEFGGSAEVGYYITPDLRIAAGYSFGSVEDRDFSGTRSANGPFLGINVKVNQLFEGFGLQKAPRLPEQKSNAISAAVNASPQSVARALENYSSTIAQAQLASDAPFAQWRYDKVTPIDTATSNGTVTPAAIDTDQGELSPGTSRDLDIAEVGYTRFMDQAIPDQATTDQAIDEQPTQTETKQSRGWLDNTLGKFEAAIKDLVVDTRDTTTMEAGVFATPLGGLETTLKNFLVDTRDIAELEEGTFHDPLGTLEAAITNFVVDTRKTVELGTLGG